MKSLLKEKYYEKSRPRPFFFSDYNVVLLTNGKCGGTSVHRWFFHIEHKEINFSLKSIRRMGLLFLILYRVLGWKKYHKSPKNHEFRKFVKYYRFFSKKVDYKNIKKAIIITRNPYDRIISSFLEKLCTGESSQNFCQDIISIIVNNNNIHLDEITFMHFLQAISLRDKLCSLNGHWAPQICIVKKLGLSIDPIKLEDFKNELTKKKYYNLAGVNLPTYNSQFKCASPFFNDASNMPISKIKEYREKYNSFPEYEDFLTLEAKKLIETIYGPDFNEFKYKI
jgi:hypothetical protein